MTVGVGKAPLQEYRLGEGVGENHVDSSRKWEQAEGTAGQRLHLEDVILLRERECQ